jgi:hypothetical protein
MSKQTFAWKNTWDHLMNDTEFRKFMTHASDDIIDLDRIHYSRINSPKGSIYIKRTSVAPDEGHFIAFQINGSKVTIFDSAKPGTRYGTWVDDQVLEIIEKRTGKTRKILNQHPQCGEEDTFCQTWSLAWLIPSLRKYTQNVNTLYTIIHKIMQSKKFNEYVDYNPTMLRTIVTEEFKRVGIKEPDDPTEWFKTYITKEKFLKLF